MLKITHKEDNAAAAVVIVAITLVVASLFFEAALLQLILTWFGVHLTIWKTLAMVVLANMICGGFRS